MKRIQICSARNETTSLEVERERRVVRDRSSLVASDEHSEIWNVPFHSSSANNSSAAPYSKYNESFDLRFYVPKGEKPTRIFIFINGFAEGKTDVWDRLGATLAREMVASVLIPLPQHFSRNVLFHINEYNENDSFRLNGEMLNREILKTYTTSLISGLLTKPQLLVHYNRQMMGDIDAVVRTLALTDIGDDHLTDFVRERLSPQVHCSIVGFSLGGLVALQAFLRKPDTFNSCILINSGASFQDMNASQVFKDDWKDLQRGIVAAARDLKGQAEAHFEAVFLGHEKVALHDLLFDHNNKILLLLGGSDPIFNRANTINIQPAETGLAVFQIPRMTHFINNPKSGGKIWDEWSRFTAKMILAFDQFRPDDGAASA